MVPAAVPVLVPPAAAGSQTGVGVTPVPGDEGTTTTGGTAPVVGPGAGSGPKIRTSVHIAFPASRDDVFKSFQAIANLADKSDGGKIKIVIEGQAAAGYDPNWLRNAVQEPLDEASIDGLEFE